MDREELLRTLRSVRPGVADREIVEQSTCFVFSGGRVHTFDDEVFCSAPVPLDIEGAVRANTLYDLLVKMNDKRVAIACSENELVVKGKRRKAGIRLEREVLLPLDAVEYPEVGWSELPDDFEQAVNLAWPCASRLEVGFIFTCVHLHPEYIEACDGFQVLRYFLDLGIDDSALVRADAIKSVVGTGVKDICVDSSWVHFRREDGLIVSYRRYLDDFAPLDKFLDDKGLHPLEIPEGMSEAVMRASIFSSENITHDYICIDLRNDSVVVEGQGPTGWYKEKKEVVYEGDPVKFFISPRLIEELANKANKCSMGDGRMVLVTDKYRYSISTVPPEEVTLDQEISAQAEAAEIEEEEIQPEEAPF